MTLFDDIITHPNQVILLYHRFIVLSTKILIP